MHVVIGGGSGFIGRSLTQALRARGDQVTWISRTAGPDRVTWTSLREMGLPRCDAVVNLAGKHILNLAERWDEAYKADLVRSRVETTQTLVEAINTSAAPPSVFVSTVGKCFYGVPDSGRPAEYPPLDEDAAPMALDYPAEMVRIWERASDGLTPAVRHVKVRVGIVLGAVERRSLLGRLWRIGRSQGFLPMIRAPFCLGVGCNIGSGAQPFPWVHVQDIVGIILHTIDSPAASGRFNAVAPGVVSSRAFTESLARHLRRPIVWTAPAWLVRWIVGSERASILLQGQNVVPRRTLEMGFRFRFPTLETALDDLVKVTV
jgi:uncharacterized protein (TIGR01777 family)